MICDGDSKAYCTIWCTWMLRNLKKNGKMLISNRQITKDGLTKSTQTGRKLCKRGWRLM